MEQLTNKRTENKKVWKIIPRPEGDTSAEEREIILKGTPPSNRPPRIGLYPHRKESVATSSNGDHLKPKVWLATAANYLLCLPDVKKFIIENMNEVIEALMGKSISNHSNNQLVLDNPPPTDEESEMEQESLEEEVVPEVEGEDNEFQEIFASEALRRSHIASLLEQAAKLEHAEEEGEEGVATKETPAELKKREKKERFHAKSQEALACLEAFRAWVAECQFDFLFKEGAIKSRITVVDEGDGAEDLFEDEIEVIKRKEEEISKVPADELDVTEISQIGMFEDPKPPEDAVEPFRQIIKVETPGGRVDSLGVVFGDISEEAKVDLRVRMGEINMKKRSMEESIVLLSRMEGIARVSLIEMKFGAPGQFTKAAREKNEEQIEKYLSLLAANLSPLPKGFLLDGTLVYFSPDGSAHEKNFPVTPFKEPTKEEVATLLENRRMRINVEAWEKELGKRIGKISEEDERIYLKGIYETAREKGHIDIMDLVILAKRGFVFHFKEEQYLTLGRKRGGLVTISLWDQKDSIGSIHPDLISDPIKEEILQDNITSIRRFLVENFKQDSTTLKFDIVRGYREAIKVTPQTALNAIHMYL